MYARPPSCAREVAVELDRPEPQALRRAACRGAGCSQRPQQLDEAGGAGDDDVGAGDAAPAAPRPRRRRPSRRPRAPRPRRRRRDRSCRRPRTAHAPGRRAPAARARRSPCATSSGGSTSSTIRPKRARKPVGSRALGDELELGPRRFGVGDACGSGTRARGPCPRRASRPSRRNACRRRAPLVGAVGQLEPVAADHLARPRPTTSSRPSAPRPAGHRADERRSARRGRAARLARLLRDGRVLRPRRRSARASRRCRAGSAAQLAAPHAVGRARPRAIRYERCSGWFRIGLAAGFFSALFGVGGGLIIVPLLLLFTRLTSGPAMATSLGAIGITALAGTVRYAFHGDVEWGYAALVGLPASRRRVVGTALQQRLRHARGSRSRSRRFLVVVGVLLLADVTTLVLAARARLRRRRARPGCSAWAAGSSSFRRCSPCI